MNAKVSCKLLAGLLVCVSQAAWSQAPIQIRISAAQIDKAGIRFSEVQSAQSTNEGLRLAGSAVTPPNRMEVVSTPAAGVVQALLVNSLDTVKAGQTIARIHSPELLQWQREYVQQFTQLDMITKKAERDESLLNDGIISAGRAQETRNLLQQARVAVQERAQMLKLAGLSEAAIARLHSPSGLTPVIDIRSTAGGSVLEWMVTPGQRVEAGAPLAKVARAGELWLELQASRAQGEHIAVGDVVKTKACTQSGKVIAIATQLSTSSQLVMVRASLPGADKCLKPGQYIEATISSKTPSVSGWSLPSTALVRNGSNEFVFVRNADGVQAVPVTVESRAIDQVIVQGALTAKQSIAIQGLASLKGLWLGLGTTGAEAK
jgi:multidrug efflux pump subunit AcrA (membrane-fusion protein)